MGLMFFFFFKKILYYIVDVVAVYQCRVEATNFICHFDLFNLSVKITKEMKTKSNPKEKIRSYLTFKTKANSHKRGKDGRC